MKKNNLIKNVKLSMLLRFYSLRRLFLALSVLFVTSGFSQFQNNDFRIIYTLQDCYNIM